MKKIIALALCLLSLLSFSACSKAESSKAEKEYVIILENATENLLKKASVTLKFGTETLGTEAMSVSDGTLAGGETLYFYVRKSDLPKGARLSDFSVSFFIDEGDGEDEWLQTVQFTPEWGGAYAYRLFYEDGYQVFPAELSETMHGYLSSHAGE